ncbi:MAG: hypothetical protein MUC29_03650 [Pyrinomonadaceae bacterium]|jgi:hypothetical protein|nr:hypothetical protein [Pyrinomonadaceae bacterium]
MILPNGITILSLENQTASVNLRANIPTQKTNEVFQQYLSKISLGNYWTNATNKNNTTNVAATEENLVPTEAQTVEVEFRALSAVNLRNRGVDFSGNGVLRNAVELFKNKSVFTNHEFRDVNDAVGVIFDAYYDEKGENSENIPGVNIKIRVDALCNFRIARGLLFKPPIINSGSVTIFFKFEYSHPELEKEDKFWSRIGEEIEGEIVRLIVIEIIEVWEFSFVTVGEDRLAKNQEAKQGGDEEDDTETTETNMSAQRKLEKGETKMKLTPEDMQKLGFDSEEVSEAHLLGKALELSNTSLTATELKSLNENAEAGKILLNAKREEVTRLAKLFELGDKTGDISAMTKKVIDLANAEELVELEKDYNEKLSAKFGTGQSSVVDGKKVDNAGDVNTDKKIKPSKMA